MSRTKRQTALIESPAAWAWWTDGYQRGVESGYEAGYAAALRVLDEAGTHLASMKPLAMVTDKEKILRARRIDTSGDLSPEENHRRAAESWGLAEGVA